MRTRKAQVAARVGTGQEFHLMRKEQERRSLRMAGETEGVRDAGSRQERAGGHRGWETGQTSVVSWEDSGAM